MKVSTRGEAAFDHGLEVRGNFASLSFEYGPGVFGPTPELRHLDEIRGTLRDPGCSGPDPVYSIVMDVGRTIHRQELQRRMLLFGVVVYASGCLGKEPVRSQGHVHSIAPHSGWSPPELFEIWEGRAIVYAQEYVADSPGRCFAIEATAGQRVVVPPGWAHCVINADVSSSMVFGAWCDRQYGFVYEPIRARRGLAWFPIAEQGNTVSWEPNPRYARSELVCRGPRSYAELGLMSSTAIYAQFTENPETVQWVSDPSRFESLWPAFEP